MRSLFEQDSTWLLLPAPGSDVLELFGFFLRVERSQSRCDFFFFLLIGVRAVPTPALPSCGRRATELGDSGKEPNSFEFNHCISFVKPLLPGTECWRLGESQEGVWGSGPCSQPGVLTLCRMAASGDLVEEEIKKISLRAKKNRESQLTLPCCPNTKQILELLEPEIWCVGRGYQAQMSEDPQVWVCSGSCRRQRLVEPQGSS